MESAEELKKIARHTELNEWLAATLTMPMTIAPLPGDASFRRYYRVTTAKQSFIAMDAPPALEKCQPFVAIAKALHDHGINTPEIFHADMNRGFLLLTDFGDTTYLKALNSDNAYSLYDRALQALSQLQSCEKVPGHVLPIFDSEFMLKEWDWHKDWFLSKWLHLPIASLEMLDQCYQLLVQSALSQPQVFMHRDFHSANLMLLEEEPYLGILDFQDAFIGPMTYDLVSLLRDCYIDWPEELVQELAISAYATLRRDKPPISQAQFLRDFDFMGLQRHLKALLTFARKDVRDKQPHYLSFIPRTLNYILKVSARYPELQALHDYYQQEVLPKVEKTLLCAQ